MRDALVLSSLALASCCVGWAGCCADGDFIDPNLTAERRDVDVIEGGSVALDDDVGLDDLQSAGAYAVDVDSDGVVVVTAPFGAGDGALHFNSGAKVVDYAVHVVPQRWSRTTFTDGPRAREHGALLTSTDGSTLFLIGGGAYPNVPTQETLDDSWQFDVASETWRAWPLSGDVIPPGASRRTAQAGDVAYLYGGYGTDVASLDDLFRVDLTTGVVKRLQQRGDVPVARSLHAFVFDADGGDFFVFGGFSDTAAGQDILADTVKGHLDGDTVTWTNVTPAFSPSPRYGMFFGFDAALRALVVFSGASFPAGNDPINAAQDAWRFDVDSETWLDLLPSGEAPLGRRNGCGVYDPQTHNLVVFGGTADGATTAPGLFLLDPRGDGAWTSLVRDDEPPLRSSSFGTALVGGGVTCGFGNDRDTFTDLFSFAPESSR